MLCWFWYIASSFISPSDQTISMYSRRLLLVSFPGCLRMSKSWPTIVIRLIVAQQRDSDASITFVWKYVAFSAELSYFSSRAWSLLWRACNHRMYWDQFHYQKDSEFGVPFSLFDFWKQSLWSPLDNLTLAILNTCSSLVLSNHLVWFP